MHRSASPGTRHRVMAAGAAIIILAGASTPVPDVIDGAAANAAAPLVEGNEYEARGIDVTPRDGVVQLEVDGFADDARSDARSDD